MNKRKNFNIIPKDIAYNQKCFCCNKTFFRLELHHIDGIRSNNYNENCLMICHKCHTLIHNHKIVDYDLPTKKRFLINTFRRALKIEGGKY